MTDQTRQLQSHIRQAYADKTPLNIQGGNTKTFYGHPSSGIPLSTNEHTGILDYSPTELVLRARAGTPLKDVIETLRAQGQMLACEPPAFGDAATFGGMVATGLSGPSRPYRAAVQDTVLGCTVLNGTGELLQFGGKVMKNVAGYDVSRLMVGALGSLGLMLDITVKVIPVPQREVTAEFTITDNTACGFINELRRKGFPVTATCELPGNKLLVRFSAGHHEITALPDKFPHDLVTGSWTLHEGDQFWRELREQQLDFFRLANQETLWRLSLPVNADISPVCQDAGKYIREWGGALVWIKSRAEQEGVFAFAERSGGHATVFRTSPGTSGATVFQPLHGTLLNWQKQLKQAFDPAAILNPGRMYREV